MIALMSSIALFTDLAARSDDPPDLVVVAGATGRTGQKAVDALLADGYRVRAFVRNIDRARAVLPASIEFSEGDIRQRSTIDNALVGATALISTIGAGFDDPLNSPEIVDYLGVRSLAEAANSAGIKNFVLVSSGGVTHEDHILNQRFNNVLMWKFKGEEAVRNSGVPYTIVRPGGLTDEPGGKNTIIFLQGDNHQGSIPRSEVARVLVAALRFPEATGKTFEIFAVEGSPSVSFQEQFDKLAADDEQN